MSKKITYSCDICRSEKKISELFGLNFTNLTEFKLDHPNKTDGVHVCFGCAEQLKNELEHRKFD